MFRGVFLRLIVLLGVVSIPASAQSLTLEWDSSPSPDVSGYNLYRSTRSGSGYSRVNTSLIPSTTYTDSTLEYDTSYFYVCTAVNLSGLESGYSNEVQARLDSNSPPPGDPPDTGTDPPPVGTTNTPPQAQSRTITVSEDQSVSVDLLMSAQDADGDALSLGAVTQGLRGTVSIVSGGTVRYVPLPNRNGADSFTYTISDGRGGLATASVSVTILPVNDPPVAHDASVVMNSGASLEIDLAGYGADVDGDPLTVGTVTQPAHGRVTIGSDGRTVTYDLVATAYRGEDHFTYTLRDPAGAQSTGTVSVRITPQNEPPLAVNDSVSLPEDSARDIDVLSNDSSSSSSLLTVLLVDLPKSGSATVRGGRVTYAPEQDFFGDDSFTYRIRDGNGNVSATARVSITVLPVNDPPRPEPDAGVTGPADELDMAVLLNDSDPDGDPLRITRVTQPRHGKVTLEDNGTLSFVPNPGFLGADEFRYWVSDGTVENSAAVQLEVASEAAPEPLLFPSLIGNGAPPFDSVFVGVALLNTQDRFDRMEVTGIAADGRAVAPASRTGSLAPLGQQTFMTHELDGSGRAQYLTASSSTQDLVGMVVVGDYDLRRRDGLNVRTAVGHQLYVPEVLMSSSSQTFLQLINRESRSGSIDLELYDSRSRRPARWSANIAPSGSLRGRVSDFFGFSDGFEGYIKVVSDVDVSGIAVSAGPEWISTVPTMVPTHARTWTAPHIFADRNGSDTLIRILNTGALDSFANLTIFTDAGQVLSTRRIFLSGQQMTLLAASELFPGLLDIKGVILGSMVLTLEGTGVPAPKVATVTYVTPKARTTVPLLSGGRNDTLFPQVAHSRADGIFTGLAIFNPSAAAANVTLDLYDVDGRRTAEAQIGLAPHSRVARLLGDPELFGPDFLLLGGHLRIRSDRPVVSYMTFGDDDGETLTAIAP